MGTLTGAGQTAKRSKSTQQLKNIAGRPLGAALLRLELPSGFCANLEKEHGALHRVEGDTPPPNGCCTATLGCCAGTIME